MPTCFQFHKKLSLVKELCNHLRHFYLLLEPVTLRCCEDGCCRTFTRYNSFSRHLRTCRIKSFASNAQRTEGAASSLTSVIESQLLSFENAVDNNGDETCCTSATDSLDLSDIKLFAANFMLKLMASCSTTLTNTKFVKDAVIELLTAVVDKVKQSAASLCSSAPEVMSYMNELEKLRNPFEGVDSVYILERYIGKSPSYVPPSEYVLGQHWEGKSSNASKN